MDNQNPTQVPPVNPTPSVGTPPVVEIIPPQTDPQQIPPSGKFSLSPKIILIILAILIIAVVGSGMYLSQGTQSKPTPKPTPLPTEASAKARAQIPNPTTSWKTYVDSVNHISFQYPEVWHVNNNGGNGTLIIGSNTLAILISVFPMIGPPPDTIEVKQGQTLSTRTLQIAGTSVKELIIKSNEILDKQGVRSSIAVYIPHGSNNSLEFILSDISQQSLFEQFLSTLKFTES